MFFITACPSKTFLGQFVAACFLINLLCWGALQWKLQISCNRFQCKSSKTYQRKTDQHEMGLQIFKCSLCDNKWWEKLQCWGSTRVIRRRVSNFFFFSSSCVVSTLLFAQHFHFLYFLLSTFTFQQTFCKRRPPIPFKTLPTNWKTENLRWEWIFLLFLVLCKAHSQGGGKLIKTEDSF